jgi:hypothetical protein
MELLVATGLGCFTKFYDVLRWIRRKNKNVIKTQSNVNSVTIFVNRNVSNGKSILLHLKNVDLSVETNKNHKNDH